MLTDLICRTAKPKEKTYKLFDERGMYLEVRPNGSRYFRLKYRFGGKEKRLALGVYPETSLKTARERRDTARRLVADRKDPGEERRNQKAAEVAAVLNRFDAVAREWHSKQTLRWTAHHAGQVLHQLEQDIFPAIGERAIHEIESPDLLAVIQKIEARGAKEMAHRAMQRCGAVFRYGIAIGKCARNPAADLRDALAPVDRGSMAAVSPGEVPELMRKIRSYDGHEPTRIALELLALTFVRTTELIGAEWQEFDLAKCEWRIPAQRMKMKEPHLVPLSTQAVALLELIHQLSGKGRFVFPHLSNSERHMSNNTMLYALYRMGYQGRMTGHGFRAVASTALNEIGFRPDVIERQLAHVERSKVRAAYNPPVSGQLSPRSDDLLSAVVVDGR